MRPLTRFAANSLQLVLGIACSLAARGAEGQAMQAKSRPPAVATLPKPIPLGNPDSLPLIEMRNVRLHATEHAILLVHDLRGRMITRTPGSFPVLDDPSSFAIEVSSGTVALSASDLAALMNEWVFNYRGSPLHGLKAKFDGEHLVLSGALRKGLDIPFEITSEVSLTDDGMIRSHPVKTKILGLNGEKLMKAFGLRLDKLLDLSGSRGGSVKGEDIYLDPAKLMPPPTVIGRLASVRIAGDEMVQEFIRTPGDTIFARLKHGDPAATNYVNFRGGRLQFGKLTMTDTDLQIVDQQQADAFDLNLKEYNRQLVAGYSKNLPGLGLVTYFPDYGTLK